MMKINKRIRQEGICIGVTAKERKQVVEILAALQQKCGATDDYRGIMNAVLAREALLTSAIGAGVSIGEICHEGVKRESLTAVTLKGGVDYEAPDGVPVRLAFLVAIPPDAKSDLASRLSVLLMNEDLREQLMSAVDEETFLTFLQTTEAGKDLSAGEFPLILAVIDGRHDDSAKAAAVLQQTAGKWGYLLRVEFDERGNSDGLFTTEELQEASAVLLMSGMRPDLFDGKPLLRVGVTDGIYRPEHLLKHASEAPVYRKPASRNPKGIRQIIHNLRQKKNGIGSHIKAKKE